MTTRVRAWILLSAFTCMLGSSLLSVDHLGIVDAACSDVGVPGHAARIQTDSGTEGTAEHCPICHFFRSMNQAATTSVVGVAVTEQSTVVGLASPQRRGTAAAVQLPSRAPPATSTFVLF